MCKKTLQAAYNLNDRAIIYWLTHTEHSSHLKSPLAKQRYGHYPWQSNWILDVAELPSFLSTNIWVASMTHVTDTLTKDSMIQWLPTLFPVGFF